jgi:beta-lactamase regulating signal transducer with metallopeptidase domain
MEADFVRHLISTSPAEWLIASIWQGVVLTALTWAALKLASGLRASTRFTLWLIVFFLVALLPCFAVARRLFSVDLSVLPAMPVKGFSLHLSSGWAFALEGLWLAASLLSLGRLVFSLMQVRGLLHSSEAVRFDSLPKQVQEAVSRPGKRPVEVRLSDAVDSPSVIGFFRPTVVVPRALWSELSSGDLKQILLHEMAHLERGDDWTNLLQKLLRALCPLNPALLWAERQLCREREQACDDAVLDRAGNAKAYATCLTHLAESKLVRRVSALAPGMWRRHSELAGRVENILHRRRNLGPWLSRGLVTAGLIFSLSGAAMLQRFPGVVTFASHAPAVAAGTVSAELSEEHKALFAKARLDQNHLQHAQYHEAVFHPDMSANGERASLLPKQNAKRQVRNIRHLQFLQVTQDPGTGGVTLILFTVEVPQTSRGSHGVSRSIISTTDHWISFQI